MRLAKKQEQIERKDLPTAEEYKKDAVPSTTPILEYREPVYQCPSCDSGMMCKVSMFHGKSWPTTYEYRCDKCGFIEMLRY